MNVGEKLKNLIRDLNRNPYEVAKKAHVSPSTIYSIIKRNNKKVDLDVFQKLADELGVPLDFFREDNTESSIDFDFDRINSKKPIANNYSPEEIIEMQQTITTLTEKLKKINMVIEIAKKGFPQNCGECDSAHSSSTGLLCYAMAIPQQCPNKYNKELDECEYILRPDWCPNIYRERDLDIYAQDIEQKIEDNYKKSHQDRRLEKGA